MVRFSFAGEDLVALPEGALWWPAARALLVADLHFEKASFYAVRGQMLPPYDSAATLDALEAIVARIAPHAIWCLGDSFHDRAGCERLAVDDRARLRRLTAAHDWLWISGNHDAGAAVADHCGGRVADDQAVNGIWLRHIADPGASAPEMSGHFHPRLQLVLRGRRVIRRCFVATASKLILPAFGALTGGMDARDPAILRIVGAGAEALVPVAERLLRFPLAA